MIILGLTEPLLGFHIHNYHIMDILATLTSYAGTNNQANMITIFIHLNVIYLNVHAYK